MMLIGLQVQAAMCLCCCFEGKGKGPLQHVTDVWFLRECYTAGCTDKSTGKQASQQAVVWAAVQTGLHIGALGDRR
jgi:hypothetical protein